MRNDAQIAALLAAWTYPVRRYKWQINPNGANDEVVRFVADNMGLDAIGDDPERPRARTRNRFSFDRHLTEALLSLVYCFMPFEQVYVYENRDARGKPDKSNPGRLLLRKLAARMPATIAEIEGANDGGLEAIEQWPSGHSERSGLIIPAGFKGPVIPVDRLVFHVNQQEGATGEAVACFGLCTRRSIDN